MPSNLELAKRGYELFQRGDIKTLLDEIIDDDSRFILPGPPERIPWAGSFHGKQQIAGFFAALAEAAEFSEFAPHDMFEHGDAVVVTGTSTARIKRTGKTVNNRWVQVARYRNGKLVFLEDYNDTAAYLLALS